MDWKDFTVSIVDSLAWPSVIVAAFLIFKSKLDAILGSLAKFKYKDIEVYFENLRTHAQELQIIDKSPKPVTLQTTPEKSSLEEQILNSVESAPAASILLAWSAVEAALASAVSRLSISPVSPSYRPPLHNIDLLQKHAGLGRDASQVLREMRTLRNKVSHETGAFKQITIEQAKDYAATAFGLIQILNEMQRIENSTNI